jgi:hypothetical protein
MATAGLLLSGAISSSSASALAEARPDKTFSIKLSSRVLLCVVLFL